MALVAMPAMVESDQAQYFYDGLGRLVGVVDGQGNVAVYNYDEVGNLLSIQRFATGSTGIGIFLFTPSSALAGTDVEIRGFGFNTTPADNQVDFNGTVATVVSSTAESIVATVPNGATTGPVTVTNTNGTATSPKDFVVLVPPIVADIEPENVGRDTTVQALITGFNLDTVTDVQFSVTGLSATILSGVTEQSLPIDLTATAGAPLGDHPFTLVSPLGNADSGTVTVTVTPSVPSFGLNKASVFRPFPAQTPPSGSTMVVGPGVSVEMP